MKTSLDHLRDSHQWELEHIVQVLFEEFESATSTATSEWKKRARILKVILFGSFARGGWVDDHHSGYKSDYDILVIVNDDRLIDFEFWEAAEDRLMQDKRIKYEVQLLIEPLQRVNDELAKGQYFFSDIKKEGIALYELTGHKLAEPKTLSEGEAQKRAEKYFEEAFSLARNFLVTAPIHIEMGHNKNAAFLLHQITEQTYRAFLLALTHYSPATHNIRTLRSLAEDLDQKLIDVWPRHQRRDKRKFELLRRAYVEARYSEHYEITTEELEWLESKVQALQSQVEKICKTRLAAT
ncbi:MAG: HEPN domain-containing protein [Magnetovibrio sp.]|nr:HEPN domain-containing protein [Magnetovibrio sp.]